MAAGSQAEECTIACSSQRIPNSPRRTSQRLLNLVPPASGTKLQACSDDRFSEGFDMGYIGRGEVEPLAFKPLAVVLRM